MTTLCACVVKCDMFSAACLTSVLPVGARVVFEEQYSIYVDLQDVESASNAKTVCSAN